MTTEEAEKDAGADVGAQTDQAKAPPAVSFSAEQQTHIDKLVGERLARAQEKWLEDLRAKGEAESKAAEAKRLKDEQKWEELAKSQESKAAEAERALASTAEQLERANKVVEGLVALRKKELPEAVLRALEGRDIYDQLELANAFLEAMPVQPAAANGQPGRAATRPTPPAQGRQGLTDEERRARATRTF